MNEPARNPFHVEDVPDPFGPDVTEFAARARIDGARDDANAQPWGGAGGVPAGIEGSWASRWHGEDLAWRQGAGELRTDGDRIYILFDWDGGAGHGLLEARRGGGDRLLGRYMNLDEPAINRPWAGVIVDERRIDGRYSAGRLDFRR